MYQIWYNCTESGNTGEDTTTRRGRILFFSLPPFFSFPPAFYERDRLLRRGVASRARVSDRIDRIADPISPLCRARRYTRTRTQRRETADAEVDEYELRSRRNRPVARGARGNFTRRCAHLRRLLDTNAVRDASSRRARRK